MGVKQVVGLGLMAAVLLGGQSAVAGPVLGQTYDLSWNGTGYQGYGYEAYHLYGGAFPDNGYLHAWVGGYSMTNTTLGETIDAFCADVFKVLQPTHKYTYVNGGDYFSSAKLDALGRLASNHLGDVIDSKTQAAFQLAMWEIVHETSGQWDVSSGGFRAEKDKGLANSSEAMTLANGWLMANPSEQNNMAVYVYENQTVGGKDSQSLAVFHQVPTPSTLALFGIAAVGLMFGRRASRK